MSVPIIELGPKLKDIKNLVPSLNDGILWDGTNYVTKNSTGTGNLVLATSPTIVTPTIASFTNAQHSHLNAAGGGALSLAAIADAGTMASQNASAISITGGTVNGTAIGSSSRSTGKFSTATATAGVIDGTAGNGYLEIANQSSAPSTPTAAGRIYFDSSNRLSWKGTNGWERTFDGTANTANRVYVLPDAAGTVVLDTATQTLTNKTLTGPIITATTRFVGPILAPASDSTAALQVTKADGSTAIITVDSTNSKVGIGSAPLGTTFSTFSALNGIAFALHRNVASGGSSTISRIALDYSDGTNGRAWGIQTPISTTTDKGFAILDLSTNPGSAGTARLTISSTGLVTAVSAFSTPVIQPAADSTTALKLTKADGTSGILIIDTTNNRVAINTTVNWIGSEGGSGNGMAFWVNSSLIAAFSNSGNFTPNNKFLNLTSNTAFGWGSSATQAQQNPDIYMIRTAAGTLKLAGVDTSTGSPLNILTLYHTNSPSTPSTGFGAALEFDADSSTSTQRAMGRVRTEWEVATDASRKSYMVLSAIDATQAEVDILTLGSFSGLKAWSFTKAAISGSNFALAGDGSNLYVNGSAVNLTIAGITKVQIGSAALTLSANVNLVAGASGSGVYTPIVAPLADSTTALKLTKANGTTAVVTVDTTNSAVTFAGQISTGVISASSTITALGRLTVVVSDAATASATDSAILDHGSSGTPSVGYGTALRIRGQSSTTANRDMGRIRTEWTTAADLTRASRMVLSAYAIGVETDVLSLASDGGITLLNSGNSSIRGGGTIGYMKLRSTSTLGVQIVAENTDQVPLMVFGMTSHVTSIQQWLDNVTGSNVLTSIPAGGGIRVHADPGSGAASTTTLTNATGTPVTPGTPAGYTKIWVGTTAAYVPYYV